MISPKYAEINGETLTRTVADYLAECRERSRAGLAPLLPYFIEQGVHAYAEGLSDHRPAPGEMGRELYDAIDHERTLTDEQFRRLIQALADSPDRRAALRACMRERGPA